MTKRDTSPNIGLHKLYATEKGGSINGAISIYSFAESDKSGGDYARLVNAGIGIGIGFISVLTDMPDK